MGKTQQLIDKMLEVVLEGQPKCVVVAANFEHLNFLMERIVWSLARRGIGYTLGRQRRTIFIDGSEIEFTSAGEIDFWRCGHQGYGEFWDEYAEYIYDRIQAGKGGYYLPE